MGEVERVHGTYNSTFGHDFRHRVDAASKDKKRHSGSQQDGSPGSEEDVVELHEESTSSTATAPVGLSESEGIDFSA